MGKEVESVLQREPGRTRTAPRKLCGLEPNGDVLQVGRKRLPTEEEWEYAARGRMGGSIHGGMKRQGPDS